MSQEITFLNDCSESRLEVNSPRDDVDEFGIKTVVFNPNSLQNQPVKLKKKKQKKKSKKKPALPEQCRNHIAFFIDSLRQYNQVRIHSQSYEDYCMGNLLPTDQDQNDKLVFYVSDYEPLPDRTSKGKQTKHKHGMYPMVEFGPLNRKYTQHSRQISPIYKHEIDKWLDDMHRLCLKSGIVDHEWYNYIPGGKYNPVVKFTLTGCIPKGMQFFLHVSVKKSIFDMGSSSQSYTFATAVEITNEPEAKPGQIGYLDKTAKSQFALLPHQPVFCYFWDVCFSLSVTNEEVGLVNKELFTIKAPTLSVLYQKSKKDLLCYKSSEPHEFLNVHPKVVKLVNEENLDKTVIFTIKQFYNPESWISININCEKELKDPNL